MVFLLAHGLPFNVPIGCDMLRQYSAIIDLSREKVSLTSEGIVWTAELIGSQGAPQNWTSYHIRENYYCRDYTPDERINYQADNDKIMAVQIRRNYKVPDRKDRSKIKWRTGREININIQQISTYFFRCTW